MTDETQLAAKSSIAGAGRSKTGIGNPFDVFVAAERDSTTVPGPTRATRPGRVLFVDDDPVLGRAIRRALSDEYDVQTLTNAEDALALIAGGQRFDVILCDMMMPAQTGMDFYDELVRLAPDQVERIVYMTGGAFTIGASEFLCRVTNARLEKPFKIDTLKAIMNERISQCAVGPSGAAPA